MIKLNKYIHYCWYGGKPLPKLAKKCIKSWKKYLKDYEIIEWNEKNTNLEECAFLKEAYANKKWAFVADYVRCKALYEMGGIYFDTDMEVIKDIDFLFKNNTFLGMEDSGYVAVGVWYEKEKNAYLPGELLKKYKSMKSFDVSKMSSFSIPILISNILANDNLKLGCNEIQLLDKDIVIYPRDYFYPYSYNRDNNLFTNNTCMIHYYDASWIPFKDRVENKMVRKFGVYNTNKILKSYRKGKDITRRVAKKVLFPYVKYKEYKDINNIVNDELYKKRLDNSLKCIENLNGDYIVFYNKDYIGVTNATLELFSNTCDLCELYKRKNIIQIRDAIVNNKIKKVIFSSFSKGWFDLVIALKKYDKSIIIKTFFHGSHSQILDSYGFERNREIIFLYRKKLVDNMAICKKSLISFYQNENMDMSFITNKVDLKKEYNITKSKDKIKIGIYAAGSDWRKNMYTQIAAVSLIENAVIDMVPLTEQAVKFAKMLNVEIRGEKGLKREELIERLSKNNINLYITYSECSPVLPLESLEANTICLLGNNNHYFENTKLKDYLVIDNECDVNEIKNKILTALEKEPEILKLYKVFSEENKKNAKNDVKNFLERM